MSTVSLVCMPWHALAVPSIQIGTLASILARAGIPHRGHYLYLDFMEFLSRAGPRNQALLAVEDYQQIGDHWFMQAPGEWAFAVPPIRAEDASRDNRYKKLLRSEGVPARLLERLAAVRRRVPEFLEISAARILDDDPAVVGFTTTFGQVVASLALADRLKALNPDVHIVFGGANCEGEMGETLLRSFACVDVVVRGEGEPLLVELVEALRSGAPIPPLPGLCYRSDGAATAVPQGGPMVEMDDVPFPDYDGYFESAEHSSFAADIRPVMPFESSRGCWWGAKSQCTFCGLNGTTLTHRCKSPERVVEELLYLSERYGMLDFTVVDNILDTGYFETMLPRLREHRLDLHLFYQVKANLSLEQVRMLRHAGVRTIRPGIESLSTPTLRLMKKGVTALQNLRLLKWCALFDIHVAWSILYGSPGEDPDEYDRVAELLPALVHLSPPTMGSLTVDRFSPYFDQPEQHGITLEGAPSYYRQLFDLDDDRLQSLAWTFAFKTTNARDPETYVAGLRKQVLRWRKESHRNRRALTYRRGPTFLVIEDTRTTIGRRRLVLDECESLVYLACDSGRRADAVAAEVSEALGRPVPLEEVERMLREFVAEKLMYEESGEYLSLALPEDQLANAGSAEPAADMEPEDPSILKHQNLRRGQRPAEEPRRKTPRRTG